MDDLPSVTAPTLLARTGKAPRRPRVTVCWTGISGYLAAGWRELQASRSIEVSFCVELGTRGFDRNLIDGIERFTAVDSTGVRDPERELEQICATRPDVVMLSGWTTPAYRRAARDPRLSHARFIMMMDTPWRGDLRQFLARLVLRRYLSRFSLVVVACERSRLYAQALGVPADRIRIGTYCGDSPSFSRAVGLRRQLGCWPRRFLYVGRLVDAKGIDTLLDAFGRYRTAVGDPWRLTICGSGPLAPLLAGLEGVDFRGFVQPSALPELFAEHGAFVIASRYEPWGVVIAEAAAAGLPIICSDRCGAGIDLVRDCANGLVFAANDPEGLKNAMVHIHANESMLPAFGDMSTRLVEPYSPMHWARRIEHYVCEAMRA